jgi:hypothetical protein
LIAKVSSLMRTLFSRIPPNDKVKVLHQYLGREASSLNESTSKPIFAVQGVEDPLYYALLSIISIDVQQRVESASRLVIIRSFSSGIGNGFRVFLMRSGLVSWLISSQWARLNRQVVGAVGYRSQSFNYPFADLYDFWCAYKLWRSLKNSEDISKLVIRDILVGDLVIDSYLRFKPSPCFLIKDRFVLTVLWQAHRDIRRAYDFFSRCKPAFYLSSYTTYIQHGVAVRVALRLGVPVYLVGSGFVFGKKLSLEDYFHTPDTSSYCSLFDKLDRQEEKLSTAEVQLKHRLSGGVDDATAYMKSSAYSYSDEKLPNVKGAVVIFLHDFYDSPHVYDDLIFPDFWSWICFTIDTLTQSGISFWVKPHPNQISLSDYAVQLLLQQYPQLQMISTRITNSQLVEGGMICGVTAYGTVAHELAYMGVPSIGCAKHPHYSFEFCRTAKNLDKYKYFLQTPNIQPLPVKELQRQALAFFYMHNIYCGEDNIALRRQFNAWFREVHDVEGVQLLQELVKFRGLPAYNHFVDKLVKEVQMHSAKKTVDQHD